MADQFLGEIRAVGFNFAQTGWALCDGQLMAISQNTALFSLLGTNYGGDGKSTFALPNLQGSVAIGTGQGAGLSFYDVGQTGGEDNVTIIQTQMPAHTHTVNAAASRGTSNFPGGNVWATPHYGRATENTYATTGNSSATSPLSPVGVAGGGQPHNNLPPYLVVNYIIALQGIFPARS